MEIGDKNIVIFDIDGTLANCEHRRKKAQIEEGFDWKIFLSPELVAKDKPYEQVCLMYKWFTNHSKYEVYVLTGRDEGLRDVTEAWLYRHNLFGHNALLMRKERDYRPDTEIKKEILDANFNKEEIYLAFDDRDCIVKMWRDNGIKCFQVGEGEF